MDSIKIRELEEKSTINLEETIIVEDHSGTVQASIHSLQNIVQDSLFCGNINELQQSVFNAGDIVETLGYHTAGDGGMGTYLIVDAPEEEDNDITIISLHTSNRLKAHLIYDDYISPMQAGAWGDGQTDDTDVINAMRNLGLNIKFPKRKFFMHICIDNSVSNIDFNGCTIIYDGECITVDKDIFTLQDVIVNSTDSHCISITNHHNIAISNCIFISNSEESIIDVNNCNDLAILNCKFTHPDGYIDGNSALININNSMQQTNSTIIKNCIFENINANIISASGHTVIDSCIFSIADEDNYHIIIKGGQGNITNSNFSNARMIRSDADSNVSLSDILIENIKDFAIYGIDNSNIIISKLLSVNGYLDEQNKSIFASTTNKVYLNGYISKDIDIDNYIPKISYSHIMNYSYDDAVAISNLDNGYINLYRYIVHAKIDHVIINTAIKIINTKYPLNGITNGENGQILAIYGTMQFNTGKLDQLYDQFSQLNMIETTTEENPILVKYDKSNRRWERIK